MNEWFKLCGNCAPVEGLHSLCEVIWIVMPVSTGDSRAIVPRGAASKASTSIPKAPGDFRGVLSNAAGSDYAHCSALEVEPVQTLEGEVAPARTIHSLHQVVADSEQQSEDVLGHRVVTVCWNVGNRNPPLSARIEVDVVKAGRAGRDQFQLGELLQDIAIQRRMNEGRYDFSIGTALRLALFRRPFS